MMTPTIPLKTPAVERPRGSHGRRGSGPPPRRGGGRAAGLRPAMYGRAPLRGALISSPDFIVRAAHTMPAGGSRYAAKRVQQHEKQSETAAASTAASTGWLRRRKPRTLWGRAGPTGAVWGREIGLVRAGSECYGPTGAVWGRHGPSGAQGFRVHSIV